MINIKAKDMRDAYIQVNNAFIFGGELEYERSGVTAHHSNNTIEIENYDCDLMLSDVGYSKSKWGMLCKLYFDAEAFGLFISRLKHYEHKFRGKYMPFIAMQFRDRGNVSGACLLSMGLGYTVSQGWTLQIFTRASEVSGRWVADLIFINKMIDEIKKNIKIDSPVRIIWHACGMYQSIISAPLFLLKFNPQGLQALLGEDNEMYVAGDLNHWQQAIVKRYNKCYVGDNPYNSYKSQARAVKAVTSEVTISNDILFLPSYGLVEGDDEFFEKKGFR